MSVNTQELLQTVRKHLSLIFGNSVLSNEIAKNKYFAEVVEKQVIIHSKLEILSNVEDKLTDKYCDNFERLAKEKIDLKKYEALDDIDNIIDEVNYLNVVCKNTFEKGIDDFKVDIANDVNLENSTNNEASSAEKNDENKETKADELPPLQGTKINANDFAKANNEGFAGRKEFTNNVFADAIGLGGDPRAHIYQTMAFQRLKIEMEVGKVFRWKQKLRSVYLLQFFAAGAALLYVLAGLALFVGWIVVASKGLNFESSSGGTEISVQNVFGIIVPILVMILFGINMFLRYANDVQGRVGPLQKRKLEMLAKAAIKDFKFPAVNDNLRYHFYVNSIVYAALAYIIFALIPSTIGSPLGMLISLERLSSGGLSGLESPNVVALFALNIVFLASFAPLVIVAVIGKTINPKENTELIQSLLTQYAEEAKKSGTMGQGPFGL